MDTEEHTSQINQLTFDTPRKFSSNFQRLIREKSKQTLTTTSNRYKAITDDSDSELDGDIGKIVKRKLKNIPNNKILEEKTAEKITTAVTAPKLIKNNPTVKTTIALKTKIKGGFSVKHTNNSTILFVDEKEEHERILQSVRDENIAHHTYTNNDDKSHAFVLRGLADGTKPQDIEEDLDADMKKKKSESYSR
ncbi:unnamed protein product [Psylliodes chrysocephalus]|uniref:Uncharacterized protein n=1 Tax=Psylliodes chrysocephalus TaxID=3402493 RepID=A0A9P0D221_9CUCU|nr:unnamed protein product [Psylliodes chrysocephala]